MKQPGLAWNLTGVLCFINMFTGSGIDSCISSPVRLVSMNTKRYTQPPRNGKALVSPCSTADLDALEELVP